MKTLDDLKKLYKSLVWNEILVCNYYMESIIIDDIVALVVLNRIKVET